jgi:membrane fusion protein, multidrug efflux system
VTVSHIILLKIYNFKYMKTTTILPLVLLVSMFFLQACSQKRQEGQSGGGEEAVKREAVKVMDLELKEVARSVEYPANLNPFEEVHLAPASPGRIEGIFADVGDRVSKGTPLVQMDRTQVHQAEVQLKNLELDFNRLDTLSRYGSIPQQQYDQLKTQYEVSRSNVEFMKENTRLTAPFNGIISGRYYETGEMFSGAPNTQAGKAAVLSIVQIDRLKAMVPLSEGYFPQVKKGMQATVKVDVYRDREFTANINRIYPVVDATNRTFNVELLVDNREGLLRPGMFSRITFNLDVEQAILLPSMAVLKMQGSNQRYLFLEQNGIARRISVTTGKRYDDYIEVFADELQPGDRVIIYGQSRLLDGVPVEVKD